MDNNNYSFICNHDKIKRINSKFIKCLECGETMPNQSKQIQNKTGQDFVRENPSFVRNFDRNFNNQLPDDFSSKPKKNYDFYVDPTGANRIKINRINNLYSDPPKYEVIVNDQSVYLTNSQIAKMLSDIKAIRVDKYLFKKIEKSSI